ncbi:zinc finger protein 585B-like [Trichoplusia ni]|uniref:Zinc finger protein 585B-like n=1 Tax=Trichoplusia ni TaxID=7111 RepID=A0A7E5X567_TRINI|nr:zinc finger protein 585B-like [Trichoplusia ni]
MCISFCWCDKTFSRQSLYSAHYRRIHVTSEERARRHDRPWVCEVCGKTLPNKCMLLYHQRNHTGEKPYACTQCPKTFTMKKLLQTHIGGQEKISRNILLSPADVILIESETGDNANSQEAILVPDDESNVQTPEISVEKENRDSVGASCVPVFDYHSDSSSDSSVYTDGEETHITFSQEISISQALKRPEKEQWRRALAQKLQSFEDNDACELVKKP